MVIAMPERTERERTDADGRGGGTDVLGHVDAVDEDAETGGEQARTMLTMIDDPTTPAMNAQGGAGSRAAA